MAAARNILLIISDDHAQWALPCYGHEVVAAPNLDRLATRGAVFDNAFCVTPVCSPARASLFTGLLPSQHGVHDFLGSAPRYDQRDWLAGNLTLTQHLSAAGYDTGFVGKWHVGRDAMPQPGFRSWFALNGEYPIHHQGDNGFSRDGIAERHDGCLTQVITDAGLDFLRHRDTTRPFFLTVGYYATHSPWRDQPERLVARYRGAPLLRVGAVTRGLVNPELPNATESAQREALAQYYAAVSHIDEGAGALVAELEAQDAIDETLIVYTADHGLCLGQHGVWGKGNATRPQNLLEENIRIPMILAGTEFMPQGVRPRRAFDHLDLFHTLLGFAGLVVADDAHPGQAFNPAAWDDAGRDIQFGEYGNARMARSDTHKLIAWTTGEPPELYAVGPGIDETIDIALEPGGGAIVDASSAALDAYFTRYARREATGPAALAENRFNANQAWHPFRRPLPSSPG